MVRADMIVDAAKKLQQWGAESTAKNLLARYYSYDHENICDFDKLRISTYLRIPKFEIVIFENLEFGPR
jgi:hypothetical protein